MLIFPRVGIFYGCSPPSWWQILDDASIATVVLFISKLKKKLGLWLA